MLSTTQTESAVAYNRDRWGERNSDTRRIQWGTQANPDGVWGPETVGLVAKFQAANGLAADGKVGPATNGELWRGITPTVGVWSIRSGSQWESNYDSYVRAMLSAGIREVALELNQQTDAHWHLSKWDSEAASVARIVERLTADGFRVTLMVWPKPDADFIDSMNATLRWIWDRVWYQLELDCEGGNWPTGEGAMTEYLAAALEWARPYVTTHGGRLVWEYEPVQIARGYAEQSYSYYDNDKPDRWWYAKNGPGFFQRTNLTKCLALRAQQQEEGGVAANRIICGIAGWNQTYPAEAGGGQSRSGEESILEACWGATSVANGMVRTDPSLWGGWRVWRLSFLLANPYVGSALALLRQSWEGERLPF